MKKLTGLKVETSISTGTGGDVNAPVLMMDRTTRQEINKGREDFSNTLTQLDLRVICRTPTTNGRILPPSPG